MFKTLSLATVGYASTVNQKVVTVQVERNIAPFRSSVNTTSSDPYITTSQFGEYGHFRPQLALDLQQDFTYLLERQCELCSSEQHTYKPTVYGEAIPNTVEFWQYQFHDAYVNVSMEVFQDQTCINELCNVENRFYTQAQTHRNETQLDGVIGLSRAEGTFPYQMNNTIVGNRVFTLSYDTEDKNSIFTFGGLDERYVSKDYTIDWAKTATYEDKKNWWAVYVEKATFGSFSFDINMVSLLQHRDWNFELPYPVFNRITNYYIQQNPTFVRDDHLMLSAPGACPDFETLTFFVTSKTADPISLAVTSDEYSKHDADKNVCNVLFAPSNDEFASLGMSLLEKYVVTFDNDGDRIGFVPRNFTASD